MTTAVAMVALGRARELVGQLDWNRSTEELDRVQAGIKHELETALKELAPELSNPGALVNAEGLARADHGDTAKAAAKAIKLRSGTQRAAVLLELLQADLRLWHGETDEELQQVLGLGASSERPRRVELVSMGFVEDSGKRRKTNAGLDAVVAEVHLAVARVDVLQVRRHDLEGGA